MAKWTFHRVMPFFKVPKDPPSRIPCPEMILDDLDYMIGSFEGFITEATDYVTWFLESSVGPIINDCPVSKGRELEGFAYTQRASEAHLRLHVETL